MQPISLLAIDEGLNGLALHAINETSASISAELTLTLYRQGDVRVAEGSRRVELPARGSVEIAGTTLFEHFLDLTYAYRFGPPAFEVAVGTLIDAGSKALLGECFHFPGPFPAEIESSIYWGVPAAALTRSHGWNWVTPAAMSTMQGKEAVNRFFGSLSVGNSPRTWFTQSFRFGTDIGAASPSRLFPRSPLGATDYFASLNLGHIEVSTRTVTNYNGDTSCPGKSRGTNKDRCVRVS